MERTTNIAAGPMMHLRGIFTLLIALTTVAVVAGRPSLSRAQQTRPTFTAGIAVVPISAVVRDTRNRIVRDLTRSDFEVLENGQPRGIVEFRANDRASVSLALLFDTSGSMRGPNLENGLDVADHLLGAIDPHVDEAALFTFDTAIRQETPFTKDPDAIRCALDGITAWGLTSLYDAIAETAKRLERRSSQRRALVVITDGVDTNSALTPQEVSGLAGAIEVPVYVIAVVPPRHADVLAGAAGENDLSNLAHWTGGDVRHVTAAEDASAAVAALMAELRQQYFIAIESATHSGWYQLDVRTKRQGLIVRARRGYFATPGG